MGEPYCPRPILVQIADKHEMDSSYPTPPVSQVDRSPPYRSVSPDLSLETIPYPPRTRVRFQEDYSVDKNGPASPQPEAPILPEVSPIIPALSLCRTIMHKSCQSQRISKCSGLYYSTSDSHHYILHSCRKDICLRQDMASETELVSVQQVLSLPRDEVVDMIDQLKLARRVVNGVLHFQSTPWLMNNWTTKDLSFYGHNSSDDVSDGQFQTLHLTKIFDSMKDELMSEGSCLVDYNDDDNTETNKYVYGIQNMTLWRLGVALLEIGYWKEIDSSNVEQVRRLADSRARSKVMYPKYFQIARRCLDLASSFESDFKMRKQEAVLAQTLDGLNKMIEALDIHGD
jgi:hypothetical protein